MFFCRFLDVPCISGPTVVFLTASFHRPAAMQPVHGCRKMLKLIRKSLKIESAIRGFQYKNNNNNITNDQNIIL